MLNVKKCVFLHQRYAAYHWETNHVYRDSPVYCCLLKIDRILLQEVHTFHLRHTRREKRLSISWTKCRAADV